MYVGRGAAQRFRLVSGLIRCGLVVVLAAGLSACSTTGRSFDTAEMNKIIPGQTSLEQASVLLKADPENVYRQRDGSAMARWAHKATLLTDAVYFRRELWLQFDSNGYFQHVVDRVNVLAEPGKPASTEPLAAASMRSAAPTQTSVVAVPVEPVAVSQPDRVNNSFPSPVPTGFPYSTDAFSGPTAVYPVR